MSSTYAISNGEASDAISSKGQYEVFLSFRGLDTRTGFTDHLYTRLMDAGIRVYRDDEELRVGEKIGPELIAGIEQSKIAIPIFSKGYATSKWCLNELAHIVECKRTKGLKVMPIFYDVAPFDVRHQTGDFAEAFVSHERDYGDETTSCWKEALKMVGALKGWDIQCDSNRQEGNLVKEVTIKVLRELKKAYLIVTDCLVGVDHHVEEILNKVCAEVGGVQILGIYGMGGIGKTTLSKVIYNRLLSQFENFVFLADVRETSQSKGMVFLQHQFISSLLKMEHPSITHIDEGTAAISTRFSNIKALIVLDDIDKNSQLQGLVGKRNWFGPGTRIIITTRNKRLLDSIQVDWPFELSGVASPQALQLFSKHAFRDDKPPQKHVELSKKIVEKTGGLPLALEVVGSLLYGQSMTYWHGVWKKLEKVPQKEVTEKLTISFEALDECQKHIFLDIACFFIGVDYRITIHYWDDSELFPEEAIEVLQQLCLIKVKENNLLWMHDQLRDYGRDIVRQEGILYPEKRSRLWNQEEATKIFMTKRGTEEIQGIRVRFNETALPYFVNEALAKLSKVRLFWATGYFPLKYPNQPSKAAPSNFLLENPYIFSEVRWLSWCHFPHTYIEASNFSLLNLIILDLSWSDFTIDWDGWTQIKLAKNLKVLDLTSCQKLVKTPDFSSHLQLERLILQNCFSLVEIDESIGGLVSLTHLDISQSGIEELPNSIGELVHLVELKLSQCCSLKKLPESIGGLVSLTRLDISKSGIEELPNSIGELVHLVELNLSQCCSLKKLPESIGGLVSLTRLDISKSGIEELPNSIGELVHLVELNLYECCSLKKLPESIGGLVSLTRLDIIETGIEELPNSIGELVHLVVLNLCECCSLKKLPESIGGLVSLTHLEIFEAGIEELPNSIGELVHLVELDLSECCSLKKLPESIGGLVSLTRLHICEAGIEELPNSIGELVHLVVLNLYECFSLKKLPESIGGLVSLTRLDIIETGIEELPNSIGELVHLVVLNLSECRSLKKLPESIGGLVSLTHLHISESEVEELPNSIGELVHLVVLNLSQCRSLKKLPESIGGLVSLTRLDISKSGIEELPNSIGELVHLVELNLSQCFSLKKLPESIGGLVSLTDLDISTSEIKELPNSIGCLKNLIVLRMKNSGIRELPCTIGMVKKLKEIHAEGCTWLRGGGLPMLPDSLVVLKLPFQVMMDGGLNLSNLINLVDFVMDLNERAPINWALKNRAPIERPSPWWIDSLSKAEMLDLAFPCITTLHPDLGSLSQLSHLRLIACVHLQSIPELPSNLTSLVFIRCKNLKRLPEMSQCKKLKKFTLEKCDNLVAIHGRLESLERLDIQCCRSLIKIPDVMNLKTLRCVCVKFCPKLFYESKINHEGPILTDNSPKSESECSFMRNMLRICGYSQNEEEKGKGK